MINVAKKPSKEHISLVVLYTVVVLLNIAVIFFIVFDTDDALSSVAATDHTTETPTETESLTETIASEKEALLRHIGGYLMRMVSGVGEMRSEGKPYELKAYLNDFDDDCETDARVYYNCGYARLSNRLTWEVSLDADNEPQIKNSKIASTGSKCERWSGDFENPLPGDTEFQPILSLYGTMAERLVLATDLFTVDWGRLLHGAWLLWIDGNDSVEGAIKGEIYLLEIIGEHSNRPEYNAWICLEGREPVKVSVQDVNVNELANSVNIDEDALFSPKVENSALVELDFDFKIDRVYPQ